MPITLGYGAKHSFSRLKPFEFERPDTDAYKKVEKGEVRFRYVIDMGTLAAGEPA